MMLPGICRACRRRVWWDGWAWKERSANHHLFSHACDWVAA